MLHQIVPQTDQFPETIAAGPWVKEPCCLVRRIVLRDNGHEFVVTTEAQEDGRPACFTGFHHGHYFRKADFGHRTEETERDALRRAWKQFDYRNKLLLGLIEPAPRAAY